MRRPLEQVVLEGARVRLEPLARRHVPGLVRAFAPGTLDLMSATTDCVEPSDPVAAAAYVDEAIEGWRAGNYLPFAVVDRATGNVVGCTRFGDIALAVPRLEIGWTWYRPAARGTIVNPETKLLLLEHAFEVLGCEVVTLRTSAFNLHSQAAISKLGATRDGVLRRNVHQRDGRLRDTVLFSILAERWPLVRSGLEARVAPLHAQVSAPPIDPPQPLELRRVTPDDAAAYLDFVERNVEFLAPFSPIRAEGVSLREDVEERVALGEGRCVYVAVRGSRILAQAALSNFARSAFQNATLGYSVDAEENGRGIATSLVRHALCEAFRDLGAGDPPGHGLHRVEAATLLDNVASQRVLGKVGFRYIGVSPRHVHIAGSWQDHALYALTKEAFRP